MWILPELIKAGARDFDDFASVEDPSSDHPEILDTMKQLGFYTDCSASARWIEPTETITADLATGLVFIAKLFIHERPASGTEIELWVKHLKPVWKGPMDWMKTASINWHREMRDLGIEGDDNWESFLRGTPKVSDH